MASLSEDKTTGRGDDPSPTTATGPSERIEVAPLIEHKAPASIRAAQVAIIHFFMSFTGTTSHSKSSSCKAAWLRRSLRSNLLGSCPT